MQMMDDQEGFLMKILPIKGKNHNITSVQYITLLFPIFLMNKMLQGINTYIVLMNLWIEWIITMSALFVWNFYLLLRKSYGN